jgi:chitinase
MRKLALLSATLLTLGAAVALAPQAAATTGLTATFTASAGGGKYVVANSTAAAISGWSIAFDLPAGVTASNPQNGTLTQTGTHVVATPAYYINTVAAHGNTEPYSLRSR